MWINKGGRRGVGVHELGTGLSHPEAEETGFGQDFEQEGLVLFLWLIPQIVIDCLLSSGH